ncbi:trichothecene 3-O-acetyltransferase [Coccidioides immitis RMSCC 3703]|uniref:Trichothecene 3-O-acetyltransferase n=1 Tax=Coccidioides immitis RMSCC 3703 TaxID=454286 RepID=A0A0J8U404_COCIT|nr:trichothecene 3-O-acetyltransferase [Coccidioides immitis RMSCC 3703]
MHGPLNDGGVDGIPLNILAQQPLLKIYTQISVLFPVPDHFSHSAIVDTLINGLERLCACFPWLAGQVVHEGLSECNPGTFKIKLFDKTSRLVLKDLRNDPSIPSMDFLKRAGFPFSMLDESIVAPRRTLPGSPDELEFNIDPVFLLQASFITGGLILTFVVSTIVKPTPSPSHGVPPPPPKCTWVYFTFDAASLATLKTLATNTIPQSSGYVSTDDTLSAFIWQSITRARLHRLNPSSKSTLARAVDVRGYLNIPKTYPGLLQNMTYNTYTFQELVDEPLGIIASQLRSALDPKRLAYQTRALATLFDRTPDKSTISFTASIDASTDIMLSSWAELDCYELDFNLGLGKPEVVRRPGFVPVESLIYFMPRARDGEIAVAISLRDEDLEALKVGAEFGKYAKYIG